MPSFLQETNVTLKSMQFKRKAAYMCMQQLWMQQSYSCLKQIIQQE